MQTKTKHRLRVCSEAFVITAIAGLTSTVHAAADESHAKQLFRAMSDYLVGQKVIYFTYDANLEIVTDELQKLGFASSGTATLSRPDKLRMTRTGGFSEVELVYDGKTLVAMGKELNVYARVALSGSVDELIDTLRIDYGLDAPAADLLSSNPYEIMMSNVTDVKDLGSGIIGGKECDHLAFRTEATDWEIWIAQGDKPYPCRFTITSKMMAQAPSYTIEVTEFRTGSEVVNDDFQMKLGDAKEATILELGGLSEVPNLSEKGDAQ